ncbi:MAG: hypothetical protein M3133_10560, partial [Actinomycetota bacterium]|nr:hypothetical protein [Actinomycetota bacterium]
MVASVAAGMLALGLLWILVVSPLARGEAADRGRVVAQGAQPTPPEQPELPPVTPSPKVTEPGPGEALPVEAFEIFLARDPFRPVRPVVATPAPGVTPTPGGTPPPGVAPPTGAPGATPTPTLPPTLGGEGEEDRETVEGLEVVLIDVFVEGGRE